MSGSMVFGASEVAVVVLVAGSLVFGLRLARSYRIAGLALTGGALAWLVAEGIHWVQLGLVMPRLRGEEHDSARFIVSLLGDSVYFGIGGIGVLLLFFAAVVDREPGADGRREPTVVAQQLGRAAWRYYQQRNRQERSRRDGR